MPTWNRDGRYWELPQKWLNDIVERALQRFGSLYIIQPYREQGAHHGMGDPGGRWFMVSEAFATQWQETEVACRLLRSRP
jgi:hypothetical protein